MNDHIWFQFVCVCVCVVALSSRAPVDKWPNGIDRNLENAALNFSLQKRGHLVGRGGDPELLCQRKHITEGHKHQFGEFTVPTHKHTFTLSLHTHTEREKESESGERAPPHDKPFDLLGTSHTCCHC